MESVGAKSSLPQEVAARGTLQDAPRSWDGPSALVSNGTGGIFASGWFKRWLEWEGSLPQTGGADAPEESSALEQSLEAILRAIGPEQSDGTCADGAGDGRVLYVELVAHPIDSEADVAILDRVGSAVFGAQPWQSVAELLPPGGVSPTRNRPLVADVATPGLRVVDLRVSTAPNTHGSESFQYTSRWVRMYADERALLVWWAAPEGGVWDSSQVRWPHNAVPLHNSESLQTITNADDIAGLVEAVVSDCLKHLRYYQVSWPDELDRWEGRIFAEVAKGDGPLRDLELGSKTTAHLGSLSDFLNQAGADARALTRRLEVEPMLTTLAGASDLRSQANEVTSLVRQNEVRRREAFALLSTLAVGEQLQAANEQRRFAQLQRASTDRLQSTVVWISALLLAPTLVIGIFGANLSVLAGDTYGSVWELIGWVLVAAGLSMSVLVFVQSPGSPGRRLDRVQQRTELETKESGVAGGVDEVSRRNRWLSLGLVVALPALAIAIGIRTSLVAYLVAVAWGCVALSATLGYPKKP